jgi:hypothetical protein
MSASRPSTAAAQTALKSSLVKASEKHPLHNRNKFSEWLERESIAVAGDKRCKNMVFTSEYHATLSRMIELHAQMLPLSSQQVQSCIELVWSSAPTVNRCLMVALQLEAACREHAIEPLTREKCAEVIACCLKWISYLKQSSEHPSVASLRRCVIALCDSIFIDFQPAAWRVAQPIRTLQRAKLLDAALSPLRPGAEQLLALSSSGEHDPRDESSSPCETDSRCPSTAAESTPDASNTVGMPSRLGVAASETAVCYKFRSDALVKKKLDSECLPEWLEQCSDEQLTEAACSCATYFDACLQYSKQEQHDRQQCATTISQIHHLQEKVAVLCREEDAAVRHAFALDWDKSNEMRAVLLMREELSKKQEEFDASLDSMICRQNELLKKVQDVRKND